MLYTEGGGKSKVAGKGWGNYALPYKEIGTAVIEESRVECKKRERVRENYNV